MRRTQAEMEAYRAGALNVVASMRSSLDVAPPMISTVALAELLDRFKDDINNFIDKEIKEQS